jgi:hypothetical protein
LIALAVSQAYGAELVLTGPGGSAGAAGLPGQAGEAGGDAAPLQQGLGPNNDAGIKLTLTGGGGGAGGAGAAGSPNLAPTNGGNGGNGGSATGTVSAAPVTGGASAQSWVSGGAGGLGGVPGDYAMPYCYEWMPACQASGGGGGNGGGAAGGSVAVANGGGNVLSLADAAGGAGAGSNGVGVAAGHGGGATASASGRSDSGNVVVSATARGGNGGRGYGGVGGNGASVALDQAVSGQTRGALSLTQIAQAGSGGDSLVPYNDSAVGGYGGSASSSLRLSDASASSLSATVVARAGNGGITLSDYWEGVGVATGGSASSILFLNSTRAGAMVSGDGAAYAGSSAGADVTVALTGLGAVKGSAVASGGAGFSVGYTGRPSNGGGASASLTLTGAGAVEGTASADGGNGGNSPWPGFGGDGGSAISLLSLNGAGATGGSSARAGSTTAYSSLPDAMSIVEARTSGALSVNLTNVASAPSGSATATTKVLSGGGSADAHASVSGTAYAYGGGGQFRSGGDATATLTLAGSGAISGSAYAEAGSGLGDAYYGGGGAGNAAVTVSGVTGGNYDVNLSATAIAGSSWPYSDHGQASLSVYGQSGTGAVTLSGSVTAGSDVYVGGGVDLYNAVSGLTSGALSLSQTAQGGSIGIYNPHDEYAQGGAASSELNLDNATASRLTGVTVARGGDGAGGAGGYASSVTVLRSRVAGAAVSADASAYGGGNFGGAKGNAQAIALGAALSTSRATAQGNAVSWAGATSNLSATSTANAVATERNGNGYAEAVAAAQTLQAGGASHATASAVGDNARSYAFASGVGNGGIVGVASGQGSAGAALADSIAHAANGASQVHGTAVASFGDGVGFSSAASYSSANYGGAAYGLPALDGSFQAVSNVNGAPGAAGGAALLSASPNVAAALAGPLIGSGVQGASYAIDGAGQALTYVMTGEFQFEMVAGRNLLIGFLGASALNTGFDLLDLSISNHGVSLFSHTFSSLAEANLFFSDRVLDLGLFGAGMQDVIITSSLTASSANGYAFSYALGSAVTAVPEPSGWLLLMVGLTAVLVVARRRRAAWAGAARGWPAGPRSASC